MRSNETGGICGGIRRCILVLAAALAGVSGCAPQKDAAGQGACAGKPARTDTTIEVPSCQDAYRNELPPSAVDTTPYFADYRGYRYFFACGPCRDRFLRNPAKELKKTEKRGGQVIKRRL